MATCAKHAQAETQITPQDRTNGSLSASLLLSLSPSSSTSSSATTWRGPACFLTNIVLGFFVTPSSNAPPGAFGVSPGFEEVADRLAKRAVRGTEGQNKGPLSKQYRAAFRTAVLEKRWPILSRTIRVQAGWKAGRPTCSFCERIAIATRRVHARFATPETMHWKPLAFTDVRLRTRYPNWPNKTNFSTNASAETCMTKATPFGRFIRASRFATPARCQLPRGTTPLNVYGLFPR